MSDIRTLRYQPHIDGLRALAVISVIAYHAGFKTLAGGFIGVDIFFVISGYLITSIISNGLATNTFSFKTFYHRRVRRLLPALLFVLSVTSWFSWQYLLPSDFINYAKSLASTLLFGSNFWFYLQDNYHAAESTARPLLHTWSLGVEEQFYLIFPLLLWSIRSWGKRAIVVALTTLGIVSFCFAVFTGANHPEANFYLLSSRLWELIAGGTLAIVTQPQSQQPSSHPYHFLAPVALLTVLFSLFYINDTMLHPGYITLLPVGGTLGLIALGGRSAYTTILLENRLVMYIGRLSYSLYLWHFPVFAFSYIKRLGEPPSPEIAAVLCGVVTVLSMVTYHLIEKPIRFSKNLPVKKTVTGLLGTSLLLGIFSFSVIKNEGYQERLGELEDIFAGSDRKDSFLKKDGKKCFFKVSNPKSCRFENNPNGVNLINMGDSHANAISVPLAEYAQKEGMNFYNMYLPNCPYVKDTWRHTGFKTKCTPKKMNAVRNYMLEKEPSIVVYSARFPLYLNKKPFNNGEGAVERSLYLPFHPNEKAKKRGDTVPDLIVKSFEELAQAGHLVVLIYPIPEVGWHVPKLIKKKLDEIPRYPLNLKRKAFENMSITTNYDAYLERTAYTKSILDRVNHENIIRVNPDKLFCSEQSRRCVTHNESEIYYYDDDHLSQAGARLLVKAIASELNNNLLNKTNSKHLSLNR